MMHSQMYKQTIDSGRYRLGLTRYASKLRFLKCSGLNFFVEEIRRTAYVDFRYIHGERKELTLNTECIS